MCTIGVFQAMKSSCKHALDPIFLMLFYIQLNRMKMVLLSFRLHAHSWKQVKLVESSPEVTTPDNWINNWKGKNLLSLTRRAASLLGLLIQFAASDYFRIFKNCRSSLQMVLLPR